jgi:hypothetical protein
MNQALHHTHQGEIRAMHRSLWSKALGLKFPQLKFLWVLALAALIFIAALSIGCASSSPAQTCGTLFNPVGNWQLTINDVGGGSLAGYGAIDSSGLALFFDTNASYGGAGDTVELPVISGNCSFSGNMVAYAAPGTITNAPIITDPALGTINSSTSISGSFTGMPTTNPSGTFSLAPFSPLSGSVTAVSGAKTGTVKGTIGGQAVVLSLTFTPTGTGNDMSFTTANLAGCEANGTFTEQSASNVFDVSITFVPTCPITGTFTGLGFESSSDYFGLNNGNADTYLYADILDSSNTFVMEIY